MWGDYLYIIGRTKKRSVALDESIFEGENEMNLTRSYNNWRNYRNAVAELSSLSNRSLADLGIARADIRAVARKAHG